jgi:predicted  nucleic acid-binding Zn-ribbon protein
LLDLTEYKVCDRISPVNPVIALEKVQELESEKEKLIRRYMSMQDEADDLNGRIYSLCCEIEAMNQRLVIARREAEEAARRQALQPPPSNGNGRH